MSSCIYPDCDCNAVDEWGLCGHHHWAVRSEIERGLSEVRLYLRNWWVFRVWEEQHPEVTA